MPANPFVFSELRVRTVSEISGACIGVLQAQRNACPSTYSALANARGFRSFDNFRTRILFFCGKLDLLPVSVRSH